MKRKVIVIGGGAAGFFSAITCAQASKDVEVTLFEKTGKLLSKVAVSGGGRCNVTHACFDNKILSGSYPRGEKQLKSAFSRFTTTDTIKWFEAHGVKLKTEADGRMFPQTDNSQTIIDCLTKEAKKAKVTVRTEVGVKDIRPRFDGGFMVELSTGEQLECDKIIVATGGSPKTEGFEWLRKLGHQIVEPVPSLFTFNIPNNQIVELQGIAVDPARVKIVDTKIEFSGPVLITHWGLSGPAVLKLSSFCARMLAEKEYDFKIQISWLNNKKEDALRQELFNIKAANPTKHIGNLLPVVLPKRLVEFLLQKCGINPDKRWADITKEEIQLLQEHFLYDTYHVQGKTTFKEEFVTCGGINLDDVDFKTMESKRCKGLHFAGEVLDIDGITGGFNFQAAWTTGFIAGTGALK
ncbi:MAG: NAD(P)/FAD-dependent oxidoreductase [Bacteroidota bacterium]